MSTRREIRCYDYVNHPYERVRDALSKDALSVFQSATMAATSRAQSVAAELRAEFGGIAVEADIVITIKKIEEKQSDANAGPVTHLDLEWQAAKMPGLFPVMNADLAIYSLTSTETQLDFSGVYEPPLGTFGKTLNAVVGHRIAEASVYRFVREVAEYLRRVLGSGAQA